MFDDEDPLRREVRLLADAWQRSEHEAVLPRHPVSEDRNVKVRAVKKSTPPQPVDLLDARIAAESVVVALVNQIRVEHGLRHDGAADVSDLLNSLSRWRGRLDAYAVADVLRQVRRDLLRAFDGAASGAGIAPCPSAECEDADVMLRSIPSTLGVRCPGCGRRWVGSGELERLRLLVGQ